MLTQREAGVKVVPSGGAEIEAMMISRSGESHLPI